MWSLHALSDIPWPGEWSCNRPVCFSGCVGQHIVVADWPDILPIHAPVRTTPHQPYAIIIIIICTHGDWGLRVVGSGMPLLFSQCENRYLREEKYIDAFPTNLIFGKPDGLAHRVTGKDVFVLNIHFCCTRIVPLALCRLPMNMLLGGR